MATEVDVVRAFEDAEARRLRAQCVPCGHSWRPRNGSTGVNRCPGCGRRGKVNYRWLSDSVEDVPAVTEWMGGKTDEAVG